MEKNIYIVRHCEAQEQSSNTPLTAKGGRPSKTFIFILFRN